MLKRASPKPIGAWLSRQLPGVEDYVVAKDSQGMHRRDRADFVINGWPGGELFLAVNEPALYLFAATDGGEERVSHRSVRLGADANVSGRRARSSFGT